MKGVQQCCRRSLGKGRRAAFHNLPSLTPKTPPCHQPSEPLLPFFNAIHRLLNRDALRSGCSLCHKVTRSNIDTLCMIVPVVSVIWLRCNERVWSVILNICRATEFRTHNAMSDRQLLFCPGVVCCGVIPYCVCQKFSIFFLGSVFCEGTNTRSDPPMGPSLFVERISRRHQSERTVHQLGLTLNPQTRVGVLCKAPFDEQSRAHKRFRQCH